MDLFRQSILFAAFLLTLTCGVLGQQQDIPIDRKPPQDLYRIAQAHLMGNRFTEAIPYLMELLKRIEKRSDTKDPHLAVQMKLARGWGQYFLGLSYLEIKKHDEAKTTLERYISENPSGMFRDAAELLLLEIAAGKGQWEEVVKRARLLLRKETLLTDIKHGATQFLGEGLFRLADWKACIEPLMFAYKETPSAITRNLFASMIITSYIELERYVDLFDFLPQVYRTSARFHPGVNIALLEGGDDKFHEGEYESAVLLYRCVMFKAEVVRQMNAQIAESRNDLQELQKMNTALVVNLAAMKRKAERTLKSLEDELLHLEDFPDYDQELLMRLARTHLELKRYWEAILQFRSIYDDYPKHKLAESGLYFSYTTALAMKQEERAFLEGYEYVKAYPKGEFWDWITVSLADLHNKRKEWEKTVESGAKWLIEKPNHVSGDYLNYLVAYAFFQLEAFPKALEHFGNVLTKYPDSSFREPCHYWHALTRLFLTHYTEAREEFTEFIQLFPKSYFAEDAAYRLAVAYYGEGDYANCAKTLRTFLEKHPNAPARSEALSMLGDIAAQNSELDLAIEHYKKALECALNMQQRNYATFQMARVYELEQRSSEIISLFQNYIAEWGEKANITEATYWIGNSQMRDGRPKQAIETFFNAIVTYGNNPNALGIDMILRDLLVEVKHKLPPQERNEFMEKLYKHLDATRRSTQPTLELRLITLFAERMHDSPAREAMITSILRDSNITNASPLTLLLMGRQATRTNQPEFAKKVYDHFMSKYAETDFALEALKAIAANKIAEQQYDDVRKLLHEIINRFAVAPDAGWAQKSLGDTYRHQKNYAKAIHNYNQVLTTKEWRGPLWPEALYWIGMCHLEQDNSQEAFPFFQRVYVMYEAYPQWVAKAYLQSALCLEKLGQRDQAINTHREMLTKETLASTPELQQAREALQRLGAQP
jgi:TolA-binding protein